MCCCYFCSVIMQGYAKDKENNKENRSTSPSISSPRSTLRRQAKSNNNLLVPRYCIDPITDSTSAIASARAHFKNKSLIIFKITLCSADSTIRRAVLVAKNSQKALCNAWLQSFSSCPTVKRVANILEQLPKYLMSTLVSLL